MSFTSLTQRFVVWFLLISLLPILLIGYSLLHLFEQELQHAVSQQISAIADKKVDQIDIYLRELVHDALLKAQSSNTIHKAVAEFGREFARSGANSADYRRLDTSYRNYFKHYVTNAGYYDLFLISPQGTVVYSYTHEADFATNLFSGPYRNSGLAKVTRNALDTLDSSISEFELYAPSGNTIAAFVGVPVMIEGKVAGVLALQIDNTRLYQVLLDSTGLGHSGETVVARLEDENTALVMAPLKMDPDAALKRKIQLIDKQSAAPLLHALNGERGSALAVDYRGVPVVAAWRYLPRLGWGMVSKMDTVEAFAPLYRMRNYGLLVLALSLAGALIGAIMFGRRVVIPLKKLRNNAQNIATGRLGQRVPVVGRDEMAQLAASFNTMAERLQPYYDDLEGQVMQRNMELAQSLEHLRIKDAAIASSINAIAIAGMDGKLSYVNQAFVDLWRLHGQEDAVGRSSVEFWDKQEEAQVVMEALQQHGHWQGELRARRHDGSVTDLILSANMVMDEAGKPVCTMGSFLDISERKAVAQVLAEQELLVQKAQETAHIGNFKFNPKTNIVEGSDELFRIFGKSRAEFQFNDFVDAVHPDQRDFVVSTIRLAILDKTVYDIEHALVMRDGTMKQVRAIGEVALDSDGSAKFLVGTVQDITERKRMEQALQHERDFASSLVNTAPMIVLLLDTSGTIEYINPYFEQLTGYSLDEVKGKEWFSAFLPVRDQHKIRALFQNAANAVPARGNINPIITRSGAELEIEWYSQAMRDAQGNVISVLATGQDVTARRAMEQVMSASAERLNEAQRIAKVGSWELNLLTGELIWSDEIYRLFEIDKNQFGATYAAFLNAIHPNDRDRVNLAYTESLKTRKPYEVIHRLLMSDGRIKWVQELCESEFDADGTPLFSRGTVQDITQQQLAEDLLRESEIRYHSVVAALSEGIVLNAKDGAIIAANEAAQEILGLSWDQMMRRTPVDPRWRSVHEDGTPFPGDTHPGSVTLRTGEPQSNVIMGVHKPDGRLTWISINSQPIFQPGETLPSTVVASFVDISERKRAEEMLRNTNEELEQRVEIRTALLNAAKEEAEQANKSKSLFLTSMSHELRTPLNAILGYAQLMQIDPGLPASVVENADEIKRAGDVLLSLMNDILDLSRIESGKLHLERETVHLSEVVKDCHNHNISAAKARNVSLLFAGNCAGYNVTADKRGLLQVLNNIVSNAIKYNREGGRVNISCTVPDATDNAGGKIRISVMDTGIGIAADKQSQLFESFNRLGAEMSSIEGTGIGLVISRKLIEGMKGVIGVESIHGLGSTFWIELPLAQQLDSGMSAAPAAAQAPVARKAPYVLVAEDYAPNQNVLLLQLQTMGCEVDIAAEGAAALKLWRKNNYDLILTDIDMPVMNGTEFALAVRNEERGKNSHIPIIAITATSTTSELKRYQLAGIDEVLGKPLSMDILRNGLMRWLGDFSVISSRASKRDAVHSTGNGVANATLDINYLYEILGQVNLVQARILVDTFMRTADEGLQALSSQMDNSAVVAKEMHKQKSSARTVGALHYANLAAMLEQQTKDKNFTGIGSSLALLRRALTEVEVAASNLLETQKTVSVSLTSDTTTTATLSRVICHSALVVDDDLVVLQQVKAMLDALGVSEVLTAINGMDATRVMAARGGEIEVLVCDLSMPEMDGVELIRRFAKTGFKGGLILISGADEKIISTVNKLAVLQGLRVLGQLQKPVSAAQLAILLSHTSDLPKAERQPATGPVVSKEAINAAMVANEFSIWFQPKVEATSLRVVGIEALARWQLPGGKFIPPDSFITVAEREGLIGELSQLLVSVALTEAAKLFAAGFPLKVAINLSGTWLNDLSLPEFILSKTRSAGLQSADVILEVTETGVMEDLTTALDVLSRLRLKGFGLSIDDFGIGYSSFEQLGLIPFTEMKLDRSFVSKGAEDAAARAILESSMDMAHKLGLSTVAEGVETELDLKLVRSLGCNLVQGYLIAKPMPVKDLLVWLENAKSTKKNK